MDRDPLTDILRRADAAAAMPARHADVAEIVRRRLDRRRRQRRMVVAAAAMIVVGFGTVWMSTASRDDRQGDRVAVTEIALPPRAPDVAALREELAELRRDGDAREAVVRRVMLETDGRRATRRARREDPLDGLRWQREQAALILVRQGDRLAEDLALPTPATVAYRSASETFPDTHWGAIARARLTTEH